MKAIFKNKKIMLSVLAIALVLTATIGTTLAYFTTFTSAEGRRPISIGTTTTTNEEMDDLDKVITIANDEDSNDAYVRVRAYAGSDVTMTMAGSDWIDGGDGWWYYNGILAPGATTSAIKASIKVPEGTADQFQIVVVHESIQAFDSEVSAQDADWSAALIVEGGDQ